MTYGSFTSRRPLLITLDWVRACVATILLIGSQLFIGLAMTCLRWSRGASGLPFDLYRHCVLAPSGWRKLDGGATVEYFVESRQGLQLRAQFTALGPTDFIIWDSHRSREKLSSRIARAESESATVMRGAGLELGGAASVFIRRS